VTKPNTRPTAAASQSRVGGDEQRTLPGMVPILLVAVYFSLTVARSNGWVPSSWSLMPVVETAWLNFLVVLALLVWLRQRRISLARIGAHAREPVRGGGARGAIR
jgi:protein-S-isoprenylcysteine O-methyltransferase Ste14